MTEFTASLRSQERIASLRSQEQSLSEHLTELAAARKPHALAAAEGDSKARAALNKLTAQASETERDLSDVRDALVQAIVLEEAATRQAAEADADRRLDSAKEISDRMVERYARIDAALAAIAAEGALLSEDRKALNRTGAASSHQLGRLCMPETFQRAVLAAGADRMFGVSRAVGRPMPLAGAAASLLAVRRPAVTKAV